MARTIRIRNINFMLLLVILFFLLLVVTLTSLLIGSVDVSLSEFFQILFSSNGDDTLSKIIFEIRLPRILLAIAVGGGLSVAGAVFQAILLNPLAEPYILGISSGGAFGAVLAIALNLSFILVQLFSFAGAIGVIAIVFLVGKRFGELEPNVLILSGVMVGAFFSALILLIMNFLDDSFRFAIFYLMGNLSIADSSSIYYVLICSIVLSTILIINSYKYNVVALGSTEAKHLGVNAKAIKNISYLVSSILVGAIVSVSGIIGFVGLVVPHICRLIFGIDNRIVLPVSFFVGAIFLIVADTISRTLIAPSELPVGVITAIIGAPIFIYLLKKRFKLYHR
ncbi:MAG: iron ABC transporter permease [Ignavibacteriales bacterium]|nr:iron ABC transporter permease [Ignavibacteriales bacterium]